MQTARPNGLALLLCSKRSGPVKDVKFTQAVPVESKLTGRNPFCVLSAALIAGLATDPGFLLSAHATDQQAAGAVFRGIRLGMTETEALTHIDRMAPGAFIGPLCSGNTGVGSHLNHNGRDRQIMAHTRDGYVHRIKLFRFDRSGMKTTDECRNRFDDLSSEQRGA